MAWVRLEDGFSEHPKILAAGPIPAWLHVAALAYCNRQLTDGFVPERAAHRLVDLDGIDVRVEEGKPEEEAQYMQASCRWAAEILCAHKVWIRVEGGYLIHDYLDYQPSRERVLEERRKAAERMAKHRSRKRESYAVTSPEVRGPRPDPSKPVLVPSNEGTILIEEQALYDCWRQLHLKRSPRYDHVSAQRLAKIRARRKEFSDTQLVNALTAAAQDDWSDRHKHNDLTVLFRSREKIDYWLEQGAEKTQAPTTAAGRYALEAEKGRAMNEELPA